ncbi:MAG: serine/threonine protein kinase, partial [Planctomycetaceae bacterium]|nr:serine/threonine protein kinase [Planctomycetaceae bacterium]
RLEHPNIARLFDAGMTDDGQSYLVMEHIDGAPIDAYCDGRQLSIHERLKLFLGVCAAVQSAHASLVIHRDLKPANILVRRDGAPILLDFGIAKALEPVDVTKGADERRTLGRLMTPDYASPEQLRGDPLTVASDIFSLGVVLYQLLTGRLPHVTESGLYRDFERAVCDIEPTPPSR